MNVLIVAAAILIVLLAGYALYLHWRLWQQRRQKRTNRAAANEGDNGVVQVAGAGSGPNTLSPKKSIYLLAEAMMDSKLTHTEGCMRISAIAGGLENRTQFQREYRVFFQVAEATAHIPILEEWQRLSREEKKALTEQRLAIEGKYRKAILAAVERLRVAFR